MKKNEEYWLNLYKEGFIEIDFDNGIVYSYLCDRKFGRPPTERKELCKDFDKRKNHYMSSSAGPSRKEKYHILLHRLVWICANGEIPEKIEVNHMNGIKFDNRLSNLELVTKSEQALHSRRVLGNKGGAPKGESSGMAKLTWKEVGQIRELYGKDGNSYKVLGRKFGVAFCNIRDIIKNRIWKI